MYKIFDVHTHAFPEKIAGRAVNNLAAKAGIPFYYEGTLKELAEYEKAGGVSGYLLLPIATSASMVHSVNTWAAGHVGGAAHAFGSIHPDCENITEELDYIVQLGLTGIKLHPEYQDFFVDEDRMFPIYQAIFERNLSVYFHAGVDLAYPPPIKGDAKRIAKICDMFPEGRIVAAHMGGFEQYDVVCQYLLGRENLWLDTSYAAEHMPPEQVCWMIRQHGVKRVMFGTDAPWADCTAAQNALLNTELSETELADIFYNNAADFLRL